MKGERPIKTNRGSVREPIPTTKQSLAPLGLRTGPDVASGRLNGREHSRAKRSKRAWRSMGIPTATPGIILLNQLS